LQNHRRAQELGKAFNRAVGSSMAASSKVNFVQAHVLQISDEAAESGIRYVTAERYIEGDYVKFNGNDGHVGRYTCQAARTAAAFSHFTFDHTSGSEMCVDIQGVSTTWTDPQLHSASKCFGVADHGREGMKRFFRSHECNDLCERLKLRRVSAESLELGAPVELSKCVICLSGPRERLCLPCRHLCLCDECGGDPSTFGGQCPICRGSVPSTVAVRRAPGAEAPETYIRESQLARMSVGN